MIYVFIWNADGGIGLAVFFLENFYGLDDIT